MSYSVSDYADLIEAARRGVYNGGASVDPYFVQRDYIEEEEVTPEVPPPAETAVPVTDELLRAVEVAGADFLGEEPTAPVVEAPTDVDVAALLAKVRALTTGRRMERDEAIEEVQGIMTGGAAASESISHGELYARLREDLAVALTDQSYPIVRQYLSETQRRLSGGVVRY